MTLEVGARGLIGNNTFRAFEKLGFVSQAATTLCKTLSAVVARCSYAICLPKTVKPGLTMKIWLSAKGSPPPSPHAHLHTTSLFT